jgi:SSS family solute:Na+ symporter
MIGLITLLLPALRSVPGVSIYVYAGRRFGIGARRALAATFLLSRGLSLGVILYASALVVAGALGWPVDRAVFAVGIFSVAYTSMGGLAADVWSDVIQLVVLWVGILASAVYVLWRGGSDLLEMIPAERAHALVFDATGFGDGGTFSFWPMLVGGFFLYMSYYGCDQSQAQRLVAARDDDAARRSLLWNGLLRFPVVLTYCVFGLLLAGLLRVDPAFAEAMTGRPQDSLVPTFMMGYLPSGLRGLLFAAILAAAMSSIDSAMNSLAGVTLEDVFGRPPASQNVWLSRASSLAWGVFAVASAMFFARGERGVLELINQIGSAFYGPVLGVFLVGVLARRVTARAAIVGLCGGIGVNAGLALWAPGVAWLWWNPIGCAATVGVALGISGGRPVLAVPAPAGREGWLLFAAWFIMLAVLAGLSFI